MTSRQALYRPYHFLSSRSNSSIPSSPSCNPKNYLTLLSSCKNLRPLLQIHGHLIVSGFKPDIFLATHLINSYSLFQRWDLARFVFDSITGPTVLLWNSMIRAYTRSNKHREALEMYRYMLGKSIEPDKYTFTFVVKACTAVLDSQEGVSIHREIMSRGLECDVFIATGLIDMYCKIGDLVVARELFDKMPERDVVAWNAMIAGLAQSSNPQEALRLFKNMQLGGAIEPNSVSLLNLFPAVSSLSDTKTCKAIHGYMYKRDFPSAISNGLIDMYSKCRHVHVARRIFDQMRGRDDVSWGTMMAGYAQNGDFCEVIELFDQMKRENLKMNKVSAVSAFLAAGEMKDLEKGKEIHDCAVQQRIDSDIFVATPFMTMYAKCGDLEKAKELFEEIQGRDVVTWSAIIAASVQSGNPEEAVTLFRRMQSENLKANKVTLVSVLPACAELSYLKLGKSIHCYAVKNDTDSDVSVGTALVSMYAKCESFSPALIVFNKMPRKDVVTWNALINGYAQNGEAYNALEMFYQLRITGVHPDSGTVVGVLPACAQLGDLQLGTCIHAKIVQYGFESDCHVKNALIDMYAKCGSLNSAELLFNGTDFIKDEVSWNVMIAGYIQNGRVKEAISAFHLMKSEQFRPNVVTVVSILPAAASLAALREGAAIHSYIVQMGYQSNTLVVNSLIDMYSKCGRLDFSEKIFDEMEIKDMVSWNAMLSGYAMNGHGNSAIALFTRMQECQVEADQVSFISVLSACRHAGLIEEGRKIFSSMREKHNVEPNLEHYACMVDLLGRAGLFDETLELIKSMPIEPDAGVWGALLGASRMHSNVRLGEEALKHLVKLEPGNPAHYVVLSGIYAQSDRWVDAGCTRLKMNETGFSKTPGCSWVETEKGLCISSG